MTHEPTRPIFTPFGAPEPVGEITNRTTAAGKPTKADVPPGDCVYGCEGDYHPCGRYPKADAWVEEKVGKPRRIPVGQPVWAVVDAGGDIIDLFVHKVTRESLVLHDTEKIVEGTFTPNP